MKLFPVFLPALRRVVCLCVVLLMLSCATNRPQYGSKKPLFENVPDAASVVHTFYLIGDAGNVDDEPAGKMLSVFRERLLKADSTSTLLVLGDNIYPEGLTVADTTHNRLAKRKLDLQMDVAEGFKGRKIFIPGNHDWYSGLDGLEKEEKYINKRLGKKSFLPKDNCPIDEVKIGKDIALIIIDSEWFLQDWDRNPTINKDCDIKTREGLFSELDDLLNKNQKKTTIIAMHHPVVTHGPHGGQFSLRRQLFPFKSLPLPVLGSFVNLLRKTSGASPEDIQNKRYNALARRIRTLIADKQNVIVVSGHEHNLQYIEAGRIRQVISGAGSKEEGARAMGKRDFSYGHLGYAQLSVLKDHSAHVAYFGLDSIGKEKLLYRAKALSKPPSAGAGTFPDKFPATKDTSVYSKRMAHRSGIYRFFWGDHYRKYYGTDIRAKVAVLDTLHGGLKPTTEGGGHQSASLRLEAKDGREYVMRQLRKSATRFLQATAFRDQPIEKDFRNTYSERFIMDFYTTAHPFAAIAVAKMSEDVGIRHTNPEIFYIPKQHALGDFNANFGNDLYMVEERPSDDFAKLESFGKPDHIVGTDEVLKNIHGDPKYYVDQPSYVRARLFDMLIGDWDRHTDNWRWAAYKEPRKVVYKPIPRDRDQAFFKADGTLLSILMNIPMFRHMKSFSADLKNVRWFNREPYNLDLAVANEATEADWITQAKYIQEHLSDADIDQAFEALPREVKDEEMEKIKLQLKLRKRHLEDYAKRYYKVLRETVLIVGTEKKDHFVIERDGERTKVSVFKIRKEGEQLMQQDTYSKPETKELWVYGLNDDDIFEVRGHGHNEVRIRLIGGQNHDTYTIESGRKVSIYDFKSKKNTITNPGHARVVLTDHYEANTYDFAKPYYNYMAGYPLVGYNPDDGVKIGAVVNYTVNRFNRNPFSQKHIIQGNYFFETHGYELSYRCVFPHVTGKWNFNAEIRYTSPNFSIDYFGFGNEMVNDDEVFGKDYNRVKIRTLRFTPALQWTGPHGGSATIKAGAERLRIEPSRGRFITQPGIVDAEVFQYKSFGDINFGYAFENYDNPSNPTLGMNFSISGGYKINLENTQRQFPYAESALGFSYRLVPDGRLVLATFLKGKALFNNDFEFYQAATLGGDYDLRGFRNQRFYGNQSFFQSTDLRLNLGKLRNGVFPTTFGIFGGFDYGRVWATHERSDKWHQSVGGGIWLNAVNLVTGRFSTFYSEDGIRLAVGIGFGF